MGTFFVAILSVCLVVFAFHAQAQHHGGGQNDNEIKDPATLSRVATKEIPKNIELFDLHAMKNLVLEKPMENVLYSPMSVYATLLMHLQGLPQQEKREALKEVLHITASDGNVYEYAFQEVSKRIERENEKGPSHSRDSTTSGADIANAFFVQKDNSNFNVVYKSIRNRIYPNATYMNMDFVGGSSAEATSTINSFIAEHTENHIGQFYSLQVSSDTPVVAVHTLNFHGVWEKNFLEERTQTGKFHTGEGGVIDVPMMRNEEVVSYISNDYLLFDAIELHYKGGEFSMYVVLPRPTQTIRNMTEHGDRIYHWFHSSEVRQKTRPLRVDYKIPKMKFSESLSFVKPLELSNVLGGMGARHFVDVDIHEHGTMAAAATAVGNRRPHVWSATHGVNAPHISESSSATETQFYVDRPFLLFVVHKPTQMVLFQGVVLKP